MTSSNYSVEIGWELAAGQYQLARSYARNKLMLAFEEETTKFDSLRLERWRESARTRPKGGMYVRGIE